MHSETLSPGMVPVVDTNIRKTLSLSFLLELLPNEGKYVALLINTQKTGVYHLHFSPPPNHKTSTAKTKLF